MTSRRDTDGPNAVRDTYGVLYDEALRILLRHDPIGTRVATNADVYAPALDTILPRLVTAHRTADAQRIIREELVRGLSPHDAGDERRYRALANEIWQAHQRFAARHPAAVAGPAWARGDDLDAGRALYESLPGARRPRWAARVLRVACARIASPPAVTDVLRIAAEQARWHEAHQAFSAVRDVTLDHQRRPVRDPELGALLYLAENVAKVVYNASGQPAPFDHDAGWRIAPSVRALIRAVADDGFAGEVEAALFDVERPDPSVRRTD